MKLTVRDFKDDDINAFIGMGKFLQQNGNFSECGFSLEKTVMLFTQVMVSPDYFGVIVEADDGKSVGCFVAMIQEYYFSDKKLAVDLCFGIFPDYRENAKEAMKEMLERYEQWAKKVGVIEVTASTSTGLHGDKLEKYLNASGYKTVGFTTKKRIL